MENVLTIFLYGGRTNLQRRNDICRILLEQTDLHPLIKSFPKKDVHECLRDIIFLSRRLNTVIDIEGPDDIFFIQDLTCGSFGISVHSMMYLPALRSLSSPEQVKAWVPDSTCFKNIGTFLQTELGHGSNVKDLETIASFDFKTRDFVLNSPTVSATKWWPGGLGHIVNCGIVQAQLHIGDKCYGVHSFYVVLRKKDSHEAVDGVEIGPLPERITGNYSDNGYLRFDNVHIPRQNLLAKIAVVDENGKYARQGDPFKSYLPMMKARVSVSMNATFVLKRCLLVALKYSSVRRQGRYSSKKPEVVLIDHQMQRARLLPSLGLLFGLTALSRDVLERCNREMDPGEVHLLTSCVKSHTAELITKACESARRSLGGNGFLVLSQVAPMSVLSLTGNTIEGDNTLLYIQIGRYLMGVLAGQRQSSVGGFLRGEIPTIFKRDLSSPDILRDITHQLCMKLFWRLKDELVEQMAKSKDLQRLMSQHAQDLVCCAQIFCDLLVMDAFTRQRITLNCGGKLMDDIQLLCSLHFVLLRLDNHLEMRTLSVEECPLLRSKLLEIFQSVRKNIGVVLEAINYPKELFDSPLLGDDEEDIYSSLLAEARKVSRDTFLIHPDRISSKL